MNMNEFSSARDRPFQRRRRQKSIRAKKSRSRRRSLARRGRRCLSERGNPQRGRRRRRRRRRSRFLSQFLGLFCGFQKAEKSDKRGAGDTCLEKNPTASENELRRSKVLVPKNTKREEISLESGKRSFNLGPQLHRGLLIAM